MCGICGIASPTGSVDPARLAEMSATLVHRGPDSEGSVVVGGVGLAARRLAIIDLETGDQPLANEDGSLHVVHNGEIYNYRELRRELEAQGHRFRSRGDTEVLVHLYEQHGTSFPERLRGMFALALWDANRGRLVLARDVGGRSKRTSMLVGALIGLLAGTAAALLWEPVERRVRRRPL